MMENLRMNWLQKLPESRRAEPGLEWMLWHKLPLITLAGTLLPMVIASLIWLLHDTEAGAAQERWEQMLAYMSLGAILFHWSMVVTVALGCIIVMIMKGPAYVADGFHVSHRDQPRAAMESHEEAMRRRFPFS